MRDQERGHALAIAARAAVHLGHEIADLVRNAVCPLQVHAVGGGDLEFALCRTDGELFRQINGGQRGDAVRAALGSTSDGSGLEDAESAGLLQNRETR